MEIGTLKCAKCGVDFYKDEGGICSVCGKPFCADHLYEVKEKGTVTFLCEHDKGERRGKRRKNPILRVRRFFKAKG